MEIYVNKGVNVMACILGRGRMTKMEGGTVSRY